MKLSLLIDSSKINIDDFYNKISSLFKDITYELIYVDNGENKDKLNDLYNKDLLHTRIVFYSGSINDVFDKIINYCSGNYLCVYDNNYDLDLLMKMISYLDEHKDYDYYRFVTNGKRSIIDKIKHFYPTNNFLMIRNNVVSFRCLIGYNGKEDNLDMEVTINKEKNKESFIGKMIGFNNKDLL